MSSELRFAVCIFKRIYDTDPLQDVLTLDELTTGLMRFNLRPDLLSKYHRARARLERAWEAFQKGEYRSGKQFSWLSKAKHRAEQEGKDVEAAVQAEYKRSERHARDQIRGDCRVWSPTLYQEDAPKRGTDYVEHVSCLVLDYDDGLSIEDASSDWGSWYHIIHSTWSHTKEQHRFRLILPLAVPVLAEDWLSVWEWAEKRSGGSVDAAPKSPASNFALPVVPTHEWPRRAFVHGGALLDPVVRGLVRRAAPPPAIPAAEARSHFREGEEEKVYIEPTPQGSSSEVDTEEMWDAAFDDPEWSPY